MVEIWQILEVSDISTSLQGMMMVGTGGVDLDGCVVQHGALSCLYVIC